MHLTPGVVHNFPQAVGVCGRTSWGCFVNPVKKCYFCSSTQSRKEFPKTYLVKTFFAERGGVSRTASHALVAGKQAWDLCTVVFDT